MPQRINEMDARRPAKEAVPCATNDSKVPWDESTFVAGVLEMNQVPSTSAAIREFAESSRMKITLAEARAIYQLLGPVPGSLASLAELLTA